VFPGVPFTVLSPILESTLAAASEIASPFAVATSASVAKEESIVVEI